MRHFSYWSQLLSDSRTLLPNLSIISLGKKAIEKLPNMRSIMKCKTKKLDWSFIGARESTRFHSFLCGSLRISVLAPFLWSKSRRLRKDSKKDSGERLYRVACKKPTTNRENAQRGEIGGACENDELGCIKRRGWCDGNASPAWLVIVGNGVGVGVGGSGGGGGDGDDDGDDDDNDSAAVPVQSRKPVFTSFSRKNLTSPNSESLMPMDFSIPKSPFSTAIKTERRCSRSPRNRCNAAPKSSIVCDSSMFNALSYFPWMPISIEISMNFNYIQTAYHRWFR